jgi:hypothetical protein
MMSISISSRTDVILVLSSGIIRSTPHDFGHLPVKNHSRFATALILHHSMPSIPPIVETQLSCSNGGLQP